MSMHISIPTCAEERLVWKAEVYGPVAQNCEAERGFGLPQMASSPGRTSE